MDVVANYIAKTKERAFSVVLPEGTDERIVAAARRLKDEGVAEPIVLGKDEKVRETAEQAGVDLAGITVIDPKTSEKLAAYTEGYIAGRDDIAPAVAKRMVMRPMFYGGMMVASGDADTMVAGAASATATVIQAGALTIGFGEGISTPSSFFLMVIPDFQGEKDKLFLYADCAVNIDPNAEELAEIALASAASAEKLLSEEPRVAMLSFSTKGSASHEHVDKVVRALEIARGKRGDLKIDGEFQADTAISARVAAKKIKEPSEVAGKANVLVFPDLDAGNMAYKLTQYMANAKAIGPFLQGFAKPMSDLSRGATVDDIVATTAITLAQV